MRAGDAHRQVAWLGAEVDRVSSLHNPTDFIARGPAYVAARSHYVDEISTKYAVQRYRLHHGVGSTSGIGSEPHKGYSWRHDRIPFGRCDLKAGVTKDAVGFQNRCIVLPEASNYRYCSRIHPLLQRFMITDRLGGAAQIRVAGVPGVPDLQPLRPDQREPGARPAGHDV